MSKTHNLKLIEPYFGDVMFGRKTFELRKDDRDYKVNDQLILEEYADGELTGNFFCKNIRYILRDCPEFGLKEGFCILGLY